MLRRFRSIRAAAPSTTIESQPPLPAEAFESARPFGSEQVDVVQEGAAPTPVIAYHAEAEAGPAEPADDTSWTVLDAVRDGTFSAYSSVTTVVGTASGVVSSAARQLGSGLADGAGFVAGKASSAGSAAVETAVWGAGAAAETASAALQRSGDLARSGVSVASDALSTAADFAATGSSMAARGVLTGAVGAVSFAGEAASTAGRVGATVVEHTIVKPVLAVGRGAGSFGDAVVLQPARAAKRLFLTILFVVCGTVVTTALLVALAAYFYSRGGQQPPAPDLRRTQPTTQSVLP